MQFIIAVLDTAILDYQSSFFQKHRRVKPDNDIEGSFRTFLVFFVISVLDTAIPQ